MSKKMNQKNEDDCFKNEEESSDCPEVIYKTARTAWQKEVALEFVRIRKEMANEFAEIRNELKWCKWLCVAVIATIALNIITRLI